MMCLVLDAQAGLEAALVRGLNPGMTPLLIAAQRGRLDAVDYLLKAQASPTHTDAKGCNALACALDGLT